MKHLSALIARLFGGDPLKARLFSKGAADLVVKGAGLFAVLGMNAVLARLLGVEAFGHYAFVMSAVLVLSMLARQGMDSAVLRYVPAYTAGGEWSLLKGLIRWTLSHVLIVSILLSLVALGVLFLVRAQVSADLAHTVIWGAALLPLLALTLQIQHVLRSRAWIVRAQLPDLIFRPIGVASIVVVASLSGVVLRGGDAMAVTVLVSGFGMLAAGFWLRRSLPAETFAVAPRNAAREWRRTSTGMLFVAGANLLLTQIDVLMLGVLQSTDVSGLYAVASRISGLAVFAVIALGSFGAPMIADLYARSLNDEMARVVKIMARASFVTLVPAVAFLAFFGDVILGLFGTAFHAAYGPLLVLVSGQALAACFGVSAMILTMTSHEDIAARVLTVSMVANAVLNALLIPVYGMYGAAIATGLTTIFPVAAMAYMVKARLGINPTIL